LKVEANPEGSYHWKIVLAQNNACNAMIEGYLTDDLGEYIPRTDFTLTCLYGGFVFWKVATDIVPHDIDFVKWIDWDKDGIWDAGPIPVHGILEPPIPEEPHVWYQDVEWDIGPFGEWMVVVEVHEQPYDPERPFFEWQLTIKQHDCEAEWYGFLTLDGDPILGTDFDLYCSGTLQCTVIRTPWCTVPNDIDSELIIDGGVPIPIVEPITQFPWTWIEIVDPGKNITLELTEVQMHRYFVMGGTTDSAGQLGIFPPWFFGDWAIGSGVPFATREPYLTPGSIWQNITFTQKDPITGIVKLGVPAESYVGLDHTFWDPRIGTYLRFQILLQEQGCGWIFTGEGKKPILGDVDILTFNDNTGIYSLKPGHEGEPMTPEPYLQNLSGPDGIPGTPDDPIGDGAEDPKGSSILYLPTKLYIEYWDETDWQLLVLTPFPMLMTTAVAYDIVFESDSEIDGEESEEVGCPWRYLFDCLPWKDPECNLKVTYVCSWSKLEIPTALGLLDFMWGVMEYKVREDRYCIGPEFCTPNGCLRGDANWDQIVDFKDLFLGCRTFGTWDEFLGNPVAHLRFDARCDCWNDGRIDLMDLVLMIHNYRYVHGYHEPSSWQGTISVGPSYVMANVGQTFEVNVTVSDVSDFYLALFGIRWNPTVLNLISVTPGPFPSGPTYNIAYTERNDTEGYIVGWTGSLMGWIPGDNGSGTLATLEFEVVGSGYSALNLYECSWMNSSAGQCGFETVQDGIFCSESTYTLTITTTTGGTTNPAPETYTYACGSSVQVTAIPNTDYVFDHWELDGSWNYSNPITVMMNSNHALHAVFIQSYDVTIQAYCHTEGNPVSVAITMDGSPTGYNTPHTFTGLTGTHTFTVAETDQSGHPFKYWSSCETSTTITVTTGGTYTAYYGICIIHDVAVTNVTASKTVVGQGYSMSINVTVENQGDFPETFNVTTYYNTTIIKTKTVTNLPCCEETTVTVTFTWNTTGVAKGNYTIEAVADTVPGETDTTDNTFTDGTVLVTFPGDVNGDGKVRVDDVLAVALAFGTNCGGPPNSSGYFYEPNLDITNDLKIRVDDVLITALNFGQGP